MREETRTALDRAKQDVEAGRLDDALERANNVLRHLSGKDYEEAREDGAASSGRSPVTSKNY